MYRSNLPKSGRIIVDKDTNIKLKEFLKNKSSGKTQEEIFKENIERLKVLFEYEKEKEK